MPPKSKYDLAAVHGMNRYLWSKMSDPTNGIIDANRYEGGLIPIIPTQQIPTFNNMTDQTGGSGGVPFIVYHWTSPALSTNTYIHLDHIIYMIYTADEVEMRQIANFIKDEFHRWELSAEDVNDYIQNPSNNFDSRYTAYDYKAISMVNMNAGLPTNTEGGRQEASVSIRCSYGYARTADELRA